MTKAIRDALKSKDLEDVELALIICRRMKWSAWQVRREIGKVIWPSGRFKLLDKYIREDYHHQSNRYRYKWIKDESES